MASVPYRMSSGIGLSIRLMWPDHHPGALGQECKHSGDACLGEDILVWYTILPCDTLNSPEGAQVKDVEPAFLAGIESP